MPPRLGAVSSAVRRAASVLCVLLALCTVSACPAHAERTTTGHKPTNVVTPEQFGARGNGRTDDTRALQKALDKVKAGGVLKLRSGAVYRHTAVLRARVAGEKIEGTGTLLATNPARSSFWIAADNVTIDGPTLRTTGATQRYYAFQQMGLRVAGVRGAVIEHVHVVGSAAAGIYVGQSCCSGRTRASSHFRISDVTVRDTRADGIHMTGGATDGVVTGAVVHNSGDDGIAVVSYQQDLAPCSHIAVSRSKVLGTSGGRGISVVGGRHVSYRHVYVTRSSAAGIYLAEEGAPFDTRSTSHVTLAHVTVVDANVDPDIGHGAVLIYSARRGYHVSDIAVSDLHISDTPTTAPWEVGLRSDAGAISGVSLDDVTIDSDQAPLVANVPDDDYSARTWTINGRLVPHPHG